MILGAKSFKMMSSRDGLLGHVTLAEMFAGQVLLRRTPKEIPLILLGFVLLREFLAGVHWDLQPVAVTIHHPTTSQRCECLQKWQWEAPKPLQGLGPPVVPFSPLFWLGGFPCSSRQTRRKIRYPLLLTEPLLEDLDGVLTGVTVSTVSGISPSQKLVGAVTQSQINLPLSLG